MAYVLSSVSGNLISAASAGFAPTNSADVSAIASSYQVVSATGTQLYAGTAYVTSVNDAPLSAARAGNAANASMANSAYYDGTGRLISALPDSAAVSGIASAYAESAASGKLDKTAQVVTAIGTGWNSDDDEIVSSVNGCILSADEARYAGAANWSNYARYDRQTNVPGYRSISSLPGSAEVSAIASSYAESAASSKLDATASSQFLTAVPDGYATTEYVDSSISGFAYESAVSGWTAKQDKLTFGYNTADQISSIDGSALGGMDEAAVSAIASAYAESAASSKQDSLTFGYDTASAISSIDGSALAGGGGGEADWSAESGQPGYIENKPVPKTLVAGAGITITENSTELVVASTNTLYNAGSGLTLNGTTFAVDTAVVQGKITYGYDASGNISGIDGSSLAGSDPEAADLYVQSPLYTGVSGGSAYIGWSGYNETVLWSSTATASSFTLSESISSFERLKVQGSFNAIDYWTDGDISNSTLFTFANMTYAQNPADGARLQQVGAAYTSTDGLTFTCRDGHNLYWTNSANSVGGGNTAARPGLYKVIGVNRIAGE